VGLGVMRQAFRPSLTHDTPGEGQGVVRGLGVVMQHQNPERRFGNLELGRPGLTVNCGVVRAR